MFSCYGWKTEGRKKKGTLACKGPCTLLLHIPVRTQSEISRATLCKHESSHQNHHRELLHRCTWSIEFGQG